MRPPLAALLLALSVAGCAHAPQPVSPLRDPSNPAAREAPSAGAPSAFDSPAGAELVAGAPPSVQPAPSPRGYTCPMHPHVHADAPGECPECGMTLVPARAATASSAEPARAAASPAAVGVSYACPMHPEVHAPAPGRCPKCGMALVPEATRKEAR